MVRHQLTMSSDSFHFGNRGLQGTRQGTKMIGSQPILEEQKPLYKGDLLSSQRLFGSLRNRRSGVRISPGALQKAPLIRGFFCAVAVSNELSGSHDKQHDKQK